MTQRRNGWHIVDLAPLYNNLARIRLPVEESRADVYFCSYPTGGFPAEQMPPGGEWFDTGGAPFWLAEEADSGDNVETFGQSILLPKVVTSEVWLLGATEGGSSFSGTLQFESENNRWMVPFGLTSWTSSTPDFDDALAVRCDFLRLLNQDVTLTGSLWYVKRPVELYEPVVKLTLPNVPGLHLFAVTLRLQT